MATYHAGKKGRIEVAGSRLALQEFDATEQGDDIDATSFESNGFDAGLVGIKGCAINMKGLWDSAKNPRTDPPGITPRDDLANVVCTLSTVAQKKWTLPLARVLSSKNTVPVRQAVTFEAAMKSNETYTGP